MLWQAGGRLMAMRSLCGVIVSTAIYQACCVSVFIKYHLTLVPSITCEVEQVLSKHYSSKNADVLISYLSRMYADLNFVIFNYRSPAGDELLI